jgi:hypothetical protein
MNEALEILVRERAKEISKVMNDYIWVGIALEARDCTRITDPSESRVWSNVALDKAGMSESELNTATLSTVLHT